MHAATYLHKLFGNTIHKARIKLLTEVVTAVIQSRTLQLTALARAFDKNIQERSGIRKVDRLLANTYFQTNNSFVYQQLINWVIGNKQRPIIIVDWTKLPNTEHYALRAALAAQGRAITIYEEVHPKKRNGNGIVHKKFLGCLKQMLPSDCCPVIVTDAGFKNPWFKEVLELQWDFIGRVRGLTHYNDGKGYKENSHLYSKASYIPSYLGSWLLAKKNPLKVAFYIVKSKLQGKKSYNRNGSLKIDKDSKAFSRGYREPWILVSSLKGRTAAKKVVAIYKKRMTIEESFRDLKSSQYGFNMSDNKTIKSERLIVWLMIASLASLLAWLTGQAAEKLELHYQFQANSYRHRRVLSFFYLGCQIIRKGLNLHIDWRNITFDPVDIYP